MTLLHDRRSPGNVESLLTARNLRPTILRSGPASFLSRDQFVVSGSSCLSITICYLFITIRRSRTCCLESVEDLTRNGINASSTINTIRLSRVCVAPPVVRVVMGICSWVLSLPKTFFFASGTADLARKPGKMRIRASERKLFTSTWTRTSRCHPT